MEAEDDMIVVIIGDESEPEEDSVKKEFINVKMEPPEVLDDPSTLDEFLEAVEKHGEKIEIDINLSNLKEESYEEEEFVDEEFLQNDDQGVFLRKRQKFYEDNSNQRHSMRKPSERQSLVNDLRQANPEFQDYPELLIDHLVSIMKCVKAPTPPEGYYYLNQNAMYECYKCQTESETLPAAGRHYQEKHGPRYLICFACGVDFRSTTNLYKHEKCCAAPEAMYVLKARARCLGKKGRSRPYLPSKEEIVRIMRRYNNKRYTKQTFQCIECPAVFQCAAALQAHAFLHAGLRPYKCGHCAASYTSKSALYRHEAKHKDREFICDHCSRTFKIKAALVAHMDTHKPEKKHGCDKCGKRYSQRAALHLHVRKEHLQLPPPFACQVCDKRFARMYLLKIHMKNKHGLIIMTRKMFFKSLPTMTDSQVVEKAKLIFKPNATPPVVKNIDLAEEFLESLQNAHYQEVNSLEEGELASDQEEYYYTDEQEYEESQEIDENQENSVYYETGEIRDGEELNVMGDEIKNNVVDNESEAHKVKLDEQKYEESQEIDGNQENSVYYVNRVIRDGEELNVMGDEIKNNVVDNENEEYKVKLDEQIQEQPETSYEVIIENVDVKYENGEDSNRNESKDSQENYNKTVENNEDITCQEIKVQRVLRNTKSEQNVNDDRQMMIKISGTRLKSKKIRLN